jgi:hypothetical protein
MVQTIVTVVMPVAGALVWLAYMHPTAFASVAAPVCRGIALISLGATYGWSRALDQVRESQLHLPLADAANLSHPPLAAWLAPIALLIFTEVLGLFPHMGLTDEHRRQELRDKERAARRPPFG